MRRKCRAASQFLTTSALPMPHTVSIECKHPIGSGQLGLSGDSCQQTRNACDQILQHVASFGKELPWINLA